MIDLHCHILPGVDDGALDLADSVAMAAVAERDGIRVVCATPHIRDDHDVRIDELGDKVQALQRELDGRNIAVRIAHGGELAQPAADALTDPRSIVMAQSSDRCAPHPANPRGWRGAAAATERQCVKKSTPTTPAITP